MKSSIPIYIGDCPNPRDFEKVQRNLERALKTQENLYEWKKKQPNQTIKYEDLK